MAGTTNANNPYSGVTRLHNRGTEGDVREWQRKEIYKQGPERDYSFRIGGAGGSDSGPIVSQVGYRDDYLYFDSTQKNATSDTASGRLSFSIPVLNKNQSLSNCIGIRIRPLYFPRLTGPATQPDPFFFRKVYILIADPLTAGINGANNTRFHFEFDVVNLTSVAIDLQPSGDTDEGGVFYLPKAAQISDITFQFLVPALAIGGPSLRSLALPTDLFSLRTVPNTNPAEFEILSSLGVTTADIGPIGVAPAPGYAIYFSNLNSGNNTVDAQVNDPLGQFITTILTATTFQVANLDFTVPPMNATAFQLSGVVGANRIAFTVQFISIRPNENTNFVQVVHS